MTEIEFQHKVYMREEFMIEEFYKNAVVMVIIVIKEAKISTTIYIQQQGVVETIFLRLRTSQVRNVKP